MIDYGSANCSCRCRPCIIDAILLDNHRFGKEGDIRWGSRQLRQSSRHSSPATSTQSVACWRKTLGSFTSDMPTRTFTTGRRCSSRRRRDSSGACRLLVERGAEVYTNPMNTYPPVMQAAWNKHAEVVKYFLEEIPDKAAGTNGLGVAINLAARQAVGRDRS